MSKLDWEREKESTEKAVQVACEALEYLETTMVYTHCAHLASRVKSPVDNLQEAA